jgi:hypothetical protein
LPRNGRGRWLPRFARYEALAARFNEMHDRRRGLAMPTRAWREGGTVEAIATKLARGIVDDQGLGASAVLCPRAGSHLSGAKRLRARSKNA